MKNHSQSRQPYYLGWFFNCIKRREFIALFYSTPNQCDQLFPTLPALSSTDSQLHLLTQKSTGPTSVPFLGQESRNSLNATNWGSFSTNLVSLFSRILETTVFYALWSPVYCPMSSHLGHTLFVVVLLGRYNSAFIQ